LVFVDAPTLSASDRSFVFAVVRRILRCADASADATQDALLLAHRHRDKFRGEANHRTWLYRIAVTAALTLLRKQRRCREDLVVDPELASEPASPEPSPEAVVASRQLAARARGVLANVGASQRAVFELRAADCTESEIATRLGISLANVKIRAHRARLRIRETLALDAIDEQLALG
jgi:RNA polymerase sigma-70 factor (ECF subfamily)